MAALAAAGGPIDKLARYAEAAQGIAAVLGAEPDRIARMATVAAILADAFPTFLWTGFYVVDARKTDELVVGPYQGKLGCLRIPFGKGVCGAAAQGRRTVIVTDVHAFPGHITCDSRSNSEIVLPVIASDGQLIAVLDVDSAEFAAFDAVDAEWLTRILTATFGGAASGGAEGQAG